MKLCSQQLQFGKLPDEWHENVETCKRQSISQISRHSAHEGGKVVTPTHRPPLPPRGILVLIFRVDPGHMDFGKKSPVTRPGIDPETLRLVAQRLNHYATPSSSINYTLL